MHLKTWKTDKETVLEAVKQNSFYLKKHMQGIEKSFKKMFWEQLSKSVSQYVMHLHYFEKIEKSF